MRLAEAGHAVPVQVDFQLARRPDQAVRRDGSLGAAQQRPDARHQLAWEKGLTT